MVVQLVKIEEEKKKVEGNVSNERQKRKEQMKEIEKLRTELFIEKKKNHQKEEA